MEWTIFLLGISLITTNISRSLVNHPISVSECSYYQGTGCCEASNLKLLDLWLEHKLDEKKMVESLEKELSLDQLYETKYPMAGMKVVTLTPEGYILRKKRSQDVGAFPGAYGLIPSGMVEPIPGCEIPSVYYSFLRELDEEMFRGPKKGETVNSLLKRPHTCYNPSDYTPGAYAALKFAKSLKL